jgi:hypothetical protein
MRYFALVRSKLEYAFVAGNSVTNTDSNKLEQVQTFCSTGFLLSLFFNPEDGDDTFLRNVG